MVLSDTASLIMSKLAFVSFVGCGELCGVPCSEEIGKLKIEGGRDVKLLCYTCVVSNMTWCVVS